MTVAYIVQNFNLMPNSFSNLWTKDSLQTYLASTLFTRAYLNALITGHNGGHCFILHSI